MSSSQLILDTDILSLLMRSNPAVVAKASAYLVEHQRFTISVITRYEILRGLKAKALLNKLTASNSSAGEIRFFLSTMKLFSKLRGFMRICISAEN